MNYYTCEAVNKLPKEVLEVFYSYTASSKNIYNSTLYLIRQLVTSYEKVIKENNKISYVLKDNLNINTIEVLNLAHQTVELINLKRLNNIDKLRLQIDLLGCNKTVKEILIKLKKEYDKLSSNYEPEISGQTYYKFLDANFLNNLLKLKEQSSSYKDYTQISSHIANAAVDRAIQDYKNYLASLKSYSNNKAKFLGLPKLPGYKYKDSRLTYELDKNRLTKEGYLARVITEQNIKLLALSKINLTSTRFSPVLKRKI